MNNHARVVGQLGGVGTLRQFPEVVACLSSSDMFQDLDSANLPALFAVDPDGNEALVNFRMEGRYVVVERVGSLFTLRNGDEALCLFNEDRPFRPRDARPRTSIKFKR